MSGKTGIKRENLEAEREAKMGGGGSRGGEGREKGRDGGVHLGKGEGERGEREAGRE